MPDHAVKPFAPAPGEGFSVENPLGGVLTFKAVADRSGRSLSAVAETLIDAPPGSFVFIPRGTPHTWQNIGDAPARFFATIMPASIRFEQFFVRYSRLPPDERGAAAFARLAQQTQAFEVLCPPLSDSTPP